MNDINVITIEKNIPIPEIPGRGCSMKYDFIQNMEITDSFHINGNTPDFTTVSVRAHVYKLNVQTERRYTIRTMIGKSSNPNEIRIWRVK